MSYSLITPCCNYPSSTPEGQGDCIKKDTCTDRHALQGAIYGIHCSGPTSHQGSGRVVLECNNKVTVAQPKED